jgi:hypothetical protein
LKPLSKNPTTLQQTVSKSSLHALALAQSRVPKSSKKKHGINNESVWLIPKFDKKTIQIYKVKKFACKSLKGKGVKSGIRVIYAFYPDRLKIEFLEIYFKEKSDSDMDYEFVSKYLETNLAP